MTKSRAKDEQGQFVGDNPSTPNVNEAWVETPSETSKVDESLSADPVLIDPVEGPAGSEPAAVELTTSATTPLKEKQSKEAIEASIQEKLSKRSSEEVDPFVPSAQLQKEVKEIAEQAGFSLSRGTEAGAALMARALRQAKS